MMVETRWQEVLPEQESCSIWAIVKPCACVWVMLCQEEVM